MVARRLEALQDYFLLLCLVVVHVGGGRLAGRSCLVLRGEKRDKKHCKQNARTKKVNRERGMDAFWPGGDGTRNEVFLVYFFYVRCLRGNGDAKPWSRFRSVTMYGVSDLHCTHHTHHAPCRAIYHNRYTVKWLSHMVQCTWLGYIFILVWYLSVGILIRSSLVESLHTQHILDLTHTYPLIRLCYSITSRRHGISLQTTWLLWNCIPLFTGYALCQAWYRPTRSESVHF